MLLEAQMLILLMINKKINIIQIIKKTVVQSKMFFLRKLIVNTPGIIHLKKL